MVGPESEQQFHYGPVEILLIEVAGDPLDPDLWDLVAEQVDADRLRLLDVVILRRDPAGELRLLEVEDLPFDLKAVPALTGLLAEDDLAELSDRVSPRANAVAVVVEHAWARAMASRLAQLGGGVLSAERIPAGVVEEVVTTAPQSH